MGRTRSRGAVKRFWKDVSVEPEGERFAIRLDERPLKTPAREVLAVPTAALAQAISGEWRNVGEEIDPRAMPLTGLANAAIDRVKPDRATFAGGLALYAEADLTCYRASGPQSLLELQQREWDKLLAWARRQFDVDFAITTGVIHVAQPAATVDRLVQALAPLDPFRLAALSPLVTIGGSLIAALAVLEKAIAPDDAWRAVSLDEQWQLDQWGADAEAEVARANRQRDFLAGARFLSLLD